MKIRFLADTNIRLEPRRGTAAPLGIIVQNTVLDVDWTPVTGELIQGNANWYRDENGWYYWAGRVEQIAEIPATPAPSAPVVTAGIVLGRPDLPQMPPRGAGPFPAGETRLVTELDPIQTPGGRELPPAEPRGIAFTDVEPMVRMAETSTSAAVISRSVEVGADRPDAPPWRDPDADKMNWGIRQYGIDRQWWYERRLTGRNIRIALLSTGIAPGHPDLAPALAADFFSYPTDGEALADRHGIGTQAAVVAAGRGLTACGVAPEAELLAGRLGAMDQNLTPEALLAGLRWAIESGADIVAMLVDFPIVPPAVLEALKLEIHRARQNGILLIAPVGNSFDRRPELRYPAGLDDVVSVGACTSAGERAAFSAKSFKLDLLAPGEGLLTADPAGRPVMNQKSTALAAAFTAGFAALVYQALRERGQAAAPETVRDLLRSSAIPFKTFNKGQDVECGYGILNPAGLLQSLTE